MLFDVFDIVVVCLSVVCRHIVAKRNIFARMKQMPCVDRGSLRAKFQLASTMGTFSKLGLNRLAIYLDRLRNCGSEIGQDYY